MAERKLIGLRDIRSMQPNSEIWDGGKGAVAGFGARRRTGDAVTYQLMFRTADGRQRRFTIGKHGSPWTPDTAREEAKRLLGEVVKGADPAAEKKAKRTAATVAELCDAYWDDAEAGRLMTRLRRPKKESTLVSDKGRIDGHIKPLLGSKPVASVTREDVEAFMHAVAEGKTAKRAKTAKRGGVSRLRGGSGTASRTMGLLGAIFTYAIRRRMRADNPVHGVMRPADGRRDRRLSDTEYKALGEALRALEADMWPPAVRMCRFLLLTGWRSGEAQALTWGEVDLIRRTATLADSKTGRSVRPLSHQACDVLRPTGPAKALVFPASKGEGKMTGWQKFWGRIAKKAGMPADVSPHIFRHSFASVGDDLGFSESTIGTVIGHKGHTVTSRYIHGADAVLLDAADKIAGRVAELMGDAKPAGTVVPLRA